MKTGMKGALGPLIGNSWIATQETEDSDPIVIEIDADGHRVLEWPVETFKSMEFARLFAAAPDLLAVAKHVLAFFDDIVKLHTPNGRDETGMGRKLRAAIEKAEGK